MTQQTNICSNCGKMILANDLYCSYCGNLHKSKVIQNRWEFLSRYNYESLLAGFIFFTLYIALNEIFLNLLPFSTSSLMIYINNILFVLSFIGALIITFLVVDNIYKELPKVSVKRFVVTSFAYNYIGVLFAILSNFIVITPTLNILLHSNIQTIFQTNIISYLVSILFVALIYTFFGLTIFSTMLYLINVKHDPTKKIPFRALLSNKLLVLSYALGIIMGLTTTLDQILSRILLPSIILIIKAFMIIPIDIILLVSTIILLIKIMHLETWQFKNYKFLIFTILVIYLGTVTIDIGSIFLLNMYYSSTIQMDLLNDFTNALFAWIVLGGVLFLRDYYLFTKSNKMKLPYDYNTTG